MSKEEEKVIVASDRLKDLLDVLSEGISNASSKIEEIRSLLATEQNNQNQQVVEVKKEPIKKKNLVVRREDDDHAEVVETTPYKIQVVGLGTTKVDF